MKKRDRKKAKKHKERKPDGIPRIVPEVSSEPTIEQASKAFLEWVKLRRSVNTLRMYHGRLKPFREQFGERLITSIQPLEVDAYFESVNKWANGGKKAPDTIRANMTAVEQLQKFVNKKRLTTYVFLSDCEKPLGRRRERIPTADEIAKIKAKATPEFNLIYQALLQSGARPNEMAKATLKHWQREESMIVLSPEEHKTGGKTGRTRKIAVGEKLKALILTSLGTRAEGHLFVTPHGKPWTTDTLSQTFARYRKAAGISDGLVLYMARHKHATEISRLHGRDAARDALGHAGEITDRYVHKDPRELCDKQDSVCL